MSGFEVSRGWGLLAVALLALSGCHRDWDGTRAAAAGPSGTEAMAAGSASLAQAGNGTVLRSGQPGMQPPTMPGPRLPFAALPDRGDLVGYPQQRVVRHQGAYTWHRADVSEAHALRAIGGGVLRLTTPDGQLLAFEYERHVEHRSGDWTWVGRLLDAPPGRQAIITFGAEAVFGSIGQSAAAPPLRLTMRDGASWLVETDPVLLAGVEGRVLRTEKPDFLIPPAVVSGQGAPTTSADSASSSDSEVGTASSTTSSSTTVVDVLVGYTSGFATALGGTSAAVTRIHNLVDITNQAYINSQVDARVRLVHTMQVSYPDATDNGDALEKLTGYKSGVGRTTPDPAFNALRDARETYGADLVTLVRKFNDPENDGCGIAWLIGGGQSTITQEYEYFGYSVVSDGQDQGTDGKTYFCREETLAHEFAHNMGSAHDVETAKGDDGVLDADDYGRYPYSFGYKTGPGSGDFFTIMAYSDKRDAPPYQQSYRVFSNPLTTFCGGFACGTSGADNARSLGQTIPLIAGFRAEQVVPPDPVGPARNDVNLDGRSDLLWSRQVAGRFVYWLMNGSTITASKGFEIGTQYTAIGTGDLDGNGRVDIIWRNNNTGATYVWLGTAAGGYITRFIHKLAGGWQLAGTGDVNGDGKSDLLWSRPSTGQFVYWLMNAETITASKGFTIGSQYAAIGTGDLDGNGRVDIIWRNNSTGATYVWLGTTAGGYVARFIYKLAGGWQLAGTGDVNGDGKSDLLWSRPSSSQFVHWLMDGATISKTKGFVASSDFAVIGTGDLDGNGLVDVVWRNAAGDIRVWLGNGSGYEDQFVYRLTGWSLLP